MFQTHKLLVNFFKSKFNNFFLTIIFISFFKLELTGIQLSNLVSSLLWKLSIP